MSRSTCRSSRGSTPSRPGFRCSRLDHHALHGADRLGCRRAGRRARSSASASVLLVAALLLSTIEPRVDTADFGIAMGVLGVGLGLLVSQLGNVVQSAVSDRDRSEAEGCSTPRSSSAPHSAPRSRRGADHRPDRRVHDNVADNPAISAETNQEVGIRVEGPVSFVAADQVRPRRRRRASTGTRPTRWWTSTRTRSYRR